MRTLLGLLVVFGLLMGVSAVGCGKKDTKKKDTKDTKKKDTKDTKDTKKPGKDDEAKVTVDEAEAMLIVGDKAGKDVVTETEIKVTLEGMKKDMPVKLEFEVPDAAKKHLDIPSVTTKKTTKGSVTTKIKITAKKGAMPADEPHEITVTASANDTTGTGKLKVSVVKEKKKDE